MSDRTVSLVGFAGSGKSTVGRILALRLHWSFKDTDALIEDREGGPIAEVYARLGESPFREPRAKGRSLNAGRGKADSSGGRGRFY